MTKLFMCGVFTLFFFQGVGQNPFYAKFKHDILPIIEDDYFGAKKEYISYLSKNKKDLPDPNDLNTLSYFGLLNEDFDFAFDLIATQIELYGYRLRPSVSENDYDPISGALLSKGVFQKVATMQDTLIHTYFKNHYQDLYVLEKLNECTFKDILLTRTYFMLRDSVSCAGIVSDHILEEDVKSFEVIKAICKREKTMINNFDHGLNAYERATFILLHVIKNKENFESVRELMVDYVEPTYSAGKIDSQLFYLFDKWENRHFGTQTYGTLKEVQFSNNRNEILKYDSNFD